MNVFQSIPTNIITGFLGAGKTTAIKHLLQYRPQSERWAVIVNEFGQIGIDGALLAGQGVAVREIPGGCLCCVTSQSFTVGLNQIIRSEKPHRILIEPTGLGHPARLIQTLCGEYYDDVIELKAVIALLDARHLQDTRYTSHQTFIDQLNMADVLVANKCDLYSDEDLHSFNRFAAKQATGAVVQATVQQGQLNPEWLDLPHQASRVATYPQKHLHNSVDINQQSDLEDWLQLETHSDGFQSTGWKLDKHHVFSRKAITNWLIECVRQQTLARIKAVVYTNEGWLMANLSDQETSFNIIADAGFTVSRLEIISPEPLSSADLDHALRQLVAS